MVYGSAKDKFAYTNNDAAKTRTALGPSASYFAMYNDRPDEAMSATEAGDTRAMIGKGANWGDPLMRNRMMWDEKYVGPQIWGSNPLNQMETKGGLTMDQRDQLLREQEAGRKVPGKAALPKAPMKLMPASPTQGDGLNIAKAANQAKSADPTTPPQGDKHFSATSKYAGGIAVPPFAPPAPWQKVMTGFVPQRGQA